MTPRRALLASLALLGFAGPPLASGCGGGYAPISEIDGLRVLAISADKPYAQPGDTVTFTLTYDDAEATGPAPDVGGGGSPSADAGTKTPRALEVLWLGGCFDPSGDEYYGCYASFAPALAALQKGEIPTDLQIALGETTAPAGSASAKAVHTFELTLPSDLISQRAEPPAGDPYYGIAYVFFAVCAGTIQPVTNQGSTGLAGSFPLGCFDASGNQLGADSFVPGYTSVYAFADGRTNANPIVNSFMIQRADTGAVVDGTGPVPACDVSEATRGSGGCGRTDPSKVCTSFDIQVEVPSNVAELDPATKDQNGNVLHEEVWVDYFADNGDIGDAILLVSDATLGIRPQFSTTWIPSPTSGTANLWAVVHDSRGGETVIQRQITIE